MKKVSIILLSLMLIIVMTACDPKMEQKSCIHVIETENATAYFDEAKKLGLTVNVWTVDDEENMKWLIDKGADYITTNEPVILQRLLEDR